MKQARNVEEVKLLIDNLAKLIDQECYSSSEIRKSPIYKEEALISQHVDHLHADSELRGMEGKVFYLILKR